ncbi:hypothetical protein K461DRAFT_292640 [Myriangium duriaei CBS 260.36]|uniref:Formin GTPase-binding domain-containing protein n=1 Tax=Myriangium duriaei CBS 260.36 TaxID=1168546 RepID=A0A9P4J5Q2_9PEZI|nr:hypothetical protein K461DRAFT_292640 [Myriangium duriaei CBS 260.36]
MAQVDRSQRSPTKSSSAGLQSKILPKTRNRMSKDISHEHALGLRSHNAQSVPLLPPDHPHAKPHGLENVAPRSTDGERASRAEERGDLKKQHKRSKSAVSLRSLVGGGESKKTKEKKPKDQSPEKQNQSPKKAVKKTKSSTGLASLFGRRNKSSKDLTETTNTEETSAPVSAVTTAETPIWAQFASQQESEPHTHKRQPRVRTDISDEKLIGLKHEIDRYTPKDYDPSRQRDFVGIKPALSRPTSSHRPQSAVLTGSGSMVDDWQKALLSAQRAQLGSRGSETSSVSFRDDRTAPNSRPQSMHFDLHRQASGSSAEQAPLQDIAVVKRGARVAAAVAAINNKVGSPRKTEAKVDTKLDPKQVEEAFEAVLERRDIPEDQRRSMRSLTLHVKADFVRQDEKTSRPSSPVKGESMSNPFDHQTKPDDAPIESKSPSKRDRPQSRSFQFNKSDTSPTKKSRATSRPRSVQDVSQLTRTETDRSDSERGRSASLGRSAPRAAMPEDYVGYLRAMQDPTQAEVGRVHKLRILLRNETVAWVDSFVGLGGMTEIIALLHRIMAIEWREDHEDQLLHETLLCLKGISTTKVALQKLAEVADELFPKLLGMIFDEQKKGPSEFTTRGVIIAILFAYLSAASTSSPSHLATRANQILSYLEDARDPSSAPLPFVAEMHSRRPYRTWSKEVTNVTKEVFWIFLHHTNVVPLPSDPTASSPPTNFPQGPATPASGSVETRSYTARHFPGTRPPVPAAPYIGGVEWDATSYLAAHLDLLNGLLAALPDAEARNRAREDMRASGWEKVMGSTLRTCKEKFYGAVHDALRCWVAAAGEDGWDVEFVRTGMGEVGGKASGARKDRGRVELPTLGLGYQEIKFEKKTDLEGWLV